MKVQNSNIEGNKTKWMKNTLSTTLTATDADISDLKFSNLTVGRTYRVSMQGYVLLRGTSSNESGTFSCLHDGAEICRILFRADQDPSLPGIAVSTATIFVATAKTTVFSFTEAGTTELIATSSFVILEELPNHVETSQW